MNTELSDSKLEFEVNNVFTLTIPIGKSHKIYVAFIASMNSYDQNTINKGRDIVESKILTHNQIKYFRSVTYVNNICQT